MNATFAQALLVVSALTLSNAAQAACTYSIIFVKSRDSLTTEQQDEQSRHAMEEILRKAKLEEVAKDGDLKIWMRADSFPAALDHRPGYVIQNEASVAIFVRQADVFVHGVAFPEYRQDAHVSVFAHSEGMLRRSPSKLLKKVLSKLPNLENLCPQH